MIEAIVLALVILRSEEGLARLKDEFKLDDQRSIEDRINRTLFFCLNKANRKLLELKRGVKSGVSYETRNQPDPDNIFTGQELKQPDFLWGYFDPLETDEWRGNRNLTIECKRLGEKTSSQWNLNKNYVENGVSRFISEEYGYGRGVASGAMIGYIESMNFDDILSEVDDTILSSVKFVPLLTKPSEGWQEKTSNRLDHKFERPFPVSPFHLWHFWIDLRGCYAQTPN